MRRIVARLLWLLLVIAMPAGADADVSAGAETDSGEDADTRTDTDSPWPAMADETLPMAGLFYGVPHAGYQTGNMSIGYEHARRFRAAQSGEVVAVSHENRLLTQQNIDGRCFPDNPDSDWCQCVRHKLTPGQCGYTLGSSYHVGNGGAIVVELHADDGTADHQPDAEVLGRTRGLFIPTEHENNTFPFLPLEAPVRLQAGRLYHLVYRNLNPPVGCRLVRVPVERAANCPDDAGAISLNGVWHGQFTPAIGGAAGRWGPYLGDAGAGNLWKEQPDAPWFNTQTTLSFFQLRYADGSQLGEMLTGGWQAQDDGLQVIEGPTRARQVFRVQAASRHVDGLWLNYGHVPRSNQDDARLRVRLLDAEGALLASGELPASVPCRQLSSSTESRADRQCHAWGYTGFAEPVELVRDRDYTVEFSAPDRAGFVLMSVFSINTDQRDNWDEAHAEISVDAGSSWQLWSDGYFAQRDLPMMFTLRGGPRSMP